MASFLTFFKPNVMFFHRRLLIRASLFLNFCVLTYVALQAAQSGSGISSDNLNLPNGVQIIYNRNVDGDNVASASSSFSLPLPTETETELSTTLDTNNSSPPVSTESPKLPDLAIPCVDKDSSFSYTQRGSFWILNNYVPAKRQYRCNESITYTTHGDVTFLDNIIPLVQRWDGPLSMAVYTPGSDYDIAINSVAYLRQCTEPGVKERVTFHLILDERHFPKRINKLHSNQGTTSPAMTSPVNTPTSTPHSIEQRKQIQIRAANGQAIVRVERSISSENPTSHSETDEIGLPLVNCSLPAPWSTPPKSTYKQAKNLTYPVNVLRNVARQNAPTYYVLPSDAELYPSPHLIRDFFVMLRRNDSVLNENRPKVFVLPIFEVYSNQTVPETKAELISKLNAKLAVPFHQKVCSYCHTIPKSKEWLQANLTDGLHVFHVAKRHKPYQRWEPIYIGTQNDPLYDERLTWEGKSDKMTQGYALCMLDYDFMILDNAFLVHRPGVKTLHKDPVRDAIAKKQTAMILSPIYRELKVMYGYNSDCVL